MPELLDQLQSQPSWSELPLIILTHGGESRVARLLDTVAAAASGITVLERPIGGSTLVRAVEVAIRSRRRQYQVRDLLLESKQAEAALRKSDERYRFIAETAEVGYWDWDIVHDVLEWGAVCKRLFGLSEDEEISYGRFLEVVHADDRERTDQAVRVCLSGAGSYDVDYRAVWPDATVHWIRAKGNTQFENGKAVRMAGVAFDISSSKRNLEALAATQERLQLAQNAGRLAIWDWDLASDKYRWTGDVGSLYGRPAEQLASTNEIMDTIEPSDRDAVLEAAKISVRHGTEYNTEFRVVWPDKSIHWVGGRGRVIYDQDQQPMSMIGTNWDITRIKLAEEALRKTEKLAVAGQFAAAIAHEINNPLEAVTNLLYLVRSNLHDEETRRYAVAAEEELSRVNLIVTQSLRFHRQSTSLTRETVSSILDSALGIYKTRLSASRIEVRRDYSDQVPALCYSSELRQVFGNLIGNAFDAVRQNGLICLRTRDVIDAITGEAGVRVTVADTGHGMDPQTLDRITEPFFTTKGINGTGLGLWISRGILEKHHARLRVRSRKSEYGSGTVFSIFLPLNGFKETAAEIADDAASVLSEARQ